MNLEHRCRKELALVYCVRLLAFNLLTFITLCPEAEAKRAPAQSLRHKYRLELTAIESARADLLFLSSPVAKYPNSLHSQTGSHAIQIQSAAANYEGSPYELNLLPKGDEKLSQAKGWQGLVPLKSGRKNVEDLLGPPSTPGGSSYQTLDENVFVQYSDGPCEKGWPYGWNVPSDTVLMIIVSPKKKVFLSDLNFDASRYRKYQTGHITNVFHYVNFEDGIDIEADDFGNLLSTAYVPTGADYHLQCPEVSGRLPNGRDQADSFFRLDEYGDLSPRQERERLDGLAEQLQRQPDYEGYIIAYAGTIARSGEAKGRAQCAKQYLINKHRIKADRIWAIDGGYRETASVELYAEKAKGSRPLPRPSVRPSRVKIVQDKHSVGCTLSTR